MKARNDNTNSAMGQIMPASIDSATPCLEHPAELHHVGFRTGWWTRMDSLVEEYFSSLWRWVVSSDGPGNPYGYETERSIERTYIQCIRCVETRDTKASSPSCIYFSISKYLHDYKSLNHEASTHSCLSSWDSSPSKFQIYPPFSNSPKAKLKDL